jgi:hypothetical protein
MVRGIDGGAIVVVRRTTVVVAQMSQSKGEKMIRKHGTGEVLGAESDEDGNEDDFVVEEEDEGDSKQDG